MIGIEDFLYRIAVAMKMKRKGYLNELHWLRLTEGIPALSSASGR
jgi:hypothetical protein